MPIMTKVALEGIKGVDGKWDFTAQYNHSTSPSGGTALTPPTAETMTDLVDPRHAIKSFENLFANKLSTDADE